MRKSNTRKAKTNDLATPTLPTTTDRFVKPPMAERVALRPPIGSTEPMPLTILLPTRSRLFALLIAVAMVAAACVIPTTNATFTYTVESNIVYGQGAIDGGAATTNLLLDLYIPDTEPGDGPMPLMVMIHGGGFVGGSKTQSNLVSAATRYAQRGYLVASINYRLGGSDPLPSSAVQPIWDLVQPNPTPVIKGLVAAIDDTLTAIEFLHERDDVFDPWTILWGSSAGAITALNVGYILDDFGIDGPDIAAVIDLWGGFYLTPDGPPFEGANEPPLFVVHGTADTVVPYALTENIVNWQADSGNPLEVHAIAGAGHGVNLFTVDASPGVSLYQRSVDFLDEQLFEPLEPFLE